MPRSLASKREGIQRVEKNVPSRCSPVFDIGIFERHHLSSLKKLSIRKIQLLSFGLIQSGSIQSIDELYVYTCVIYFCYTHREKLTSSGNHKRRVSRATDERDKIGFYKRLRELTAARCAITSNFR